MSADTPLCRRLSVSAETEQPALSLFLSYRHTASETHHSGPPVVPPPILPVSAADTVPVPPTHTITHTRYKVTPSPTGVTPGEG